MFKPLPVITTVTAIESMARMVLSFIILCFWFPNIRLWKSPPLCKVSGWQETGFVRPPSKPPPNQGGLGWPFTLNNNCIGVIRRSDASPPEPGRAMGC